MDLRQLRSFIAVAEEEQFTRAAERLGIAQSSLSAQIRGLEGELGVSLFARTTRHVELTDAGQILLTRARSVLAQVSDMTSEIQLISGLLSGRVVIGMTPTPGAVDVVGLLAEFGRRYPNIELSVREILSVRLGQELREDHVDIGILSVTDPADLRGLDAETLAVEELVVILPLGHALSGAGSVDVAQLAGERLITSARGATIRTAVFAAARRAGVELTVGFELNETDRIRRMVATGLGVGVLPRSDASGSASELAVIPFRGQPLMHEVSLCWRSGRTHSSAALALMETARSLAPPDVRPQRAR